MNKLSRAISTVRFLSYLFFCCGLIFTIIDFAKIFQNALQPDLGALIGYAALMAVGLIGAVVGGSPTELHRRLRGLEEQLQRQQQPKTL